MRCYACPCALLAAVAFVSSSQAALIDDFSLGARQLAAMGVTQSDLVSSLEPAAVLGGSRYLSVRSLSGAQGSAEVEVGSGRFRFTNASGQLSYFTLGYGDYTFNGSATPLHVELTADGADRFVIDVVSYSSGSGVGSGTSITLWVRHAAPSGAFTQVSLGLQNGGAGRYVIPFSAFPNMPMTNVLGLGLETGRAPNGRELIVSRIATVPEPTAAASATIAVLAATALRRRMAFSGA